MLSIMKKNLLNVFEGSYDGIIVKMQVIMAPIHKGKPSKYFFNSYITNFMGHDLAIIVVRIFFIGSYGIDMDVIYLFVFFEH
jgi:hypothetical protein